MRTICVRICLKYTWDLEGGGAEIEDCWQKKNMLWDDAKFENI